MASAEAVPDPSPDAEVYAAHWGRVYETDESARTREWHCDFADCRAFIAPYCARAGDAGDGTVLDVGCGGSSFGDELRSAFGLERLVLTDIDPGIVRILRERHAARRRDDGKKGAKTTCLVADCTSMPAIADDSVDVVVDKGTLDALHGEEDKLKMMRECARVVKKRGRRRERLASRRRRAPSFCGASPTRYGWTLSSQSSVVVTPSLAISYTSCPCSGFT